MTENKDLATQPNEFSLMDQKDEEMILQEMSGEHFLQQYVYSFKQGGRDITNLSYAGIKEAIRRRGHFQIIDHQVEEVNGKIRAIVKVHDLVNDIDVLGASEADAEKPFAFVLATNKAERNAYAKLIPAKFFAELIAEKLGKSTTPKPVNVTPPTTTPAPLTTVPDKCPKCGALKDPKYKLCYDCNEEEKAGNQP